MTYKDGTKVSGFVQASENRPPRQCSNCKWLRKGNSCTHPVVMADPEMIKHSDGTGAVDGDDCCDYFQNK